MTIFKIRKNFGKFLCNLGFHDFEIINILNSYNSHLKGHENLRLVGGLDSFMPIDFVHKTCKRCGLDINEIEEHNLEPNEYYGKR